MRSIKRGLKTLGLALLAAMGLMAFTAVSAQAVTWDINGAEIKAHETFTAKLKTGTVLLLAPVENVVFHCTTLDVEEGLIYNSDPPKAHIAFFFLSCSTKIKGVENANCKPEILLVRAALLPILHNSKIYIRAEPLEVGKPFTTYHFNEETCPLPPLPTITGSLVFECENAAGTAQQDCKIAAATQLLRPAPPGLFPSDGLKYGLNPAETHSKAEVTLTGANIGKSFNALV